MKIEKLLPTLMANSEINKLVVSLSSAIQSRNTAPMRLMQMYSGRAVDGDQLTQDYSRLLGLIMPILEQIDFSDVSAIEKNKNYRALNNALWFAESRDGGGVRLSLLNQYVVAILLEDVAPKIDEYVDSVLDVSLHKELNIAFDDNLLVDISSDDYDLRKHGLVIKGEKLVYPHQFMRRYYRANFVDLLSILSHCKKINLSVKVRLDPLRGYCEPRFYHAIMEADHWHGKPFSDEILMSKDKTETLTFHTTYDNQRASSYPVKYTIFRSSMMDYDKGLRQFFVEEYTPSVLEADSISDLAPGFGEKYCIQKFAHFVYDQVKQQFTHIDGATRTFSIDEYAEIESIVAKGQDPGSKIGTRDKLFLVEGEIEKDLVFSLLYEYFRYNPHLEEYYAHTVSGITEY